MCDKNEARGREKVEELRMRDGGLIVYDAMPEKEGNTDRTT